MRDIVDFVSSVLAPLDIPVVFQTYLGNPPFEYITFLEYKSSPSLEVADKEIETERLVQVNVWSKGNYHQLVEDVRKKLEQAGFQRTAEFDGPYTDGDSHFNKVLRFAFFDEY